MKARVVVIDPWSEKIYNAEIDLANDSGASAIRSLIGYHFALATRLKNGDVIYIDRRGDPEEVGFLVRDYEFLEQLTFCPGIGVICGSDIHGNTLDARSTISEIEKIIQFVSVDD